MKRTKDLHGRVLARILAEDLEDVRAADSGTAVGATGTPIVTEPDEPYHPRDITNKSYDNDGPD